MSKDFLLEIGLEEVPARFIPEASCQLAEKVAQFLNQRRIGYQRIESYSTPRRLAVLVRSLEEKQSDLNEVLRGPAKRIAVDHEGNWTKAAIGFATGKGATVEDLFFQEVKGEEFVFVRIHQQGEDTVKLLPEITGVIASMHFPKNMRWGTKELRFVRPIRWLVAMYGDQVVPMSIADVESSNISYGHRFLGHPVTITQPGDYVQLLEKEYCLVDPNERRSRIVAQIKELEAEMNWNIPLDEGLLEEVTHLLEYPTVLYGTFDPEFLKIPREVLVTSMKEHQRYFPVESKDGRLLNHFVTVRNGDRRNLEGVAKGNEKVLSARLADARFFYEEDQKLSIAQCLARLENVVFHEELGTIADKVRRIRELTGEWAEILQLDEETAELVDRTASICKFDLVTNMIYEFPELQGIMGEDYARKLGEKEEVARGIFEHYLPRFSGDRLPSSDVGTLVSLADKIDTIVGSFSIGIIPTGSQDPYGLRRQAQGIVQILFEREVDLTLEQLFDSSIRIFQQNGRLKKEPTELKQDLWGFFQLRLKNLLQERGVRYDVIDAILSSPINKIPDLVARAEVLLEQVEQAEFKKTVEAFTRVNNLAAKAESNQLDPQLLIEEVEKRLYLKFLEIREKVDDAFHAGQYATALTTMAGVQSDIEQFFDKVMVMVDDLTLRNARLALLKNLSELFHRFADFNKLVFA